MGYRLIKLPVGATFPEYGCMDTFGELKYFLEEACNAESGRYYKNFELFKQEKRLWDDFYIEDAKKPPTVTKECWVVVWEHEDVINEFGVESP